MDYNLTVGGTGMGSMRIDDGAVVSNIFGKVGSTSGQAATVTVSGRGSRWDNDFALLTGVDSGDGEVHVLNGAIMNSVDGHIGSAANGVGKGLVEVSGAGSIWTNDGELKVGNMNAEGVLRIADGAVVSNKVSYIGSMVGGVGTVSVEGAGSRWNNTGDLNIGFGVFASFGTGAVTIADSAVVTVGAAGTGTVYMARGGLFPVFGPTGTLSIGAASDDAADAVGAGTLRAGLIDFGKGTATLRFNHTDSAYLFDTRLKDDGSGAINHIAGTTVLTANNTGFKGKTTVSGGHLIVQSVLSGSAAVTGGELQFGSGIAGAISSLSGDLNVSGSRSTLTVTELAALSVANTLELKDFTRLNIGANADGPSLAANRLNIGSGVAFNLSGINDEGQLPKVLISTTNGIIGDFASVTIGGFNGPVDYLSVHTGKSTDGRSYQATYGLNWTGGNNLSHGTFTLTNAADDFTLGLALRNQSPNHALGWNGRSLTKAGRGTLILTGDNLYTGGTTIQGGVLQIGNDGATGSVLGDIVNHGALAFQRSDDFAFDGIVSGSGVLIKNGAGTLTLAGANTYTGGTTLRGGVVAVAQDVNLGHADGALRFDGGALRVTGTDFTGTNRAIAWSAAGGTFDIAEAANRFEVSADINGAGAMIKRGEGTLLLSGANIFGGARIEDGGLIGTTASLSGDIALIAASSRLSLTNTDAGVFAGALSGIGRVSLDGSGTVLLTGDSSGFSGLTTLNAGKLLVGAPNGNGRLGGSLEVLSGATLGGSGAIGSGVGSHISIAAGGVLSPGNSIGTLTINGDLTFASGARFEVEVNPLGADSDLVRVTGSATLNGGTVAHIGANGRYDPRSTYTILTAASLTGAFDDVTSDFAFLNPKLHYDYGAGTVQMELLRNDIAFASAARTRNQAATAHAIEAIGFDAGNAVYEAIVQLADDGDLIRASFDQLSGELHVSAQTAMIEDSRLIRNAANDRLRAAFGHSGASSAPAFAYGSNGAPIA
ncbi:MAG TPA: outer membrane autotransporter, partial [Brevundimonas sp.]|nr:outer membrane autotransporter [Brevundimonas sp.]